MSQKLLDEYSEDSDASIDEKLHDRETHTYNWVRKEGHRVIQEYFDCEPFDVGDDDINMNYLTNKNNPDGYLPSPTVKEPSVLNSHKYVEEAYEHAIPKIIVDEERRGNIFTVMAGFNISHAITFPFLMMRFGGYYFLIPFLITTIFITLPINYAQYAFGQFSNMPPIVFFNRMAPIFLGVGTVIIVVQYITSAAIRFDHRFISMSFELFYSLFSERPKFQGLSKVEGMLYGYASICAPGEIFDENQCYSQEMYQNQRFGKTDRMYIREKVQFDLQSDPFITEYASAETPPDRIFDPIYQHAHYISAATVLSIFLFFISLLGIKAYFRRIQYIVFYGSIMACLVTVVSMVDKWDKRATILIYVIGADFPKILEHKTWILAAVNSMVLFGTVDGSYLVIGAANKFSNRLFMDLVRAKILGFVMLFLFSFVFGMAVLVGASIHFMKFEKRTLMVDDFRILIHSDDQIYEFLYVFFFQNMAHKLMMMIFMLIFCFWQISSLMLMAEGTIGTIYRCFKSTARLPQFVIRYVALLFHCSFLLFLHFFMHQFRNLPFILAPYVAFIQISSCLAISFKRTFVIFLTMSKKDRMKLYKNRKLFEFYYTVMLPGLLFAIIIFDICRNGFKTAKLTIGAVLVIGLAQIFRYKFISKISDSWTSSTRFRPTFNQDHAEYRRQEKALDGRGEIVKKEKSKNSKTKKSWTPKFLSKKKKETQKSQ